MKTSLFLLATAALQALAAPATSGDAKIFVKRSLQADSLSNIYLESIEGQVSVLYGSCEDASNAHEIATFEATAGSEPEKISWYVPGDAQSGCLFVKDSDGNIIAQSEQHDIKKRFSKRGHPELSDMYFDAVDYHQSKRIDKRSKSSSKSKSNIKNVFCFS